jgi:hypothetical protein
MRKLILSTIFILLTSYTFAQSLIVGIPSADVAEKHHLEITHETQWNFWGQTSKWNSFNFACFGLGNGLEITSGAGIVTRLIQGSVIVSEVTR